MGTLGTSDFLGISGVEFLSGEVVRDAEIESKRNDVGTEFIGGKPANAGHFERVDSR